MLLEFYAARERVVVFVLTRERMWVRRLPASYSEVSEALGQFRFQVNKFSYGQAYRERHAAVLLETANRRLQHLYEILFLPIADELTAETLVIVPHGVLHYVPFPALFDGERYMIDGKTISYAPSATILHRALTSKAGGDGKPPLLLGVSDPTIPYAQAEVESIAALFPNADVRVGERATIGGLMENEKRPAFLHLSTHATFRADNPLFSALKLADGWVSVNDIYGMAGSAPLVILSACETGRSQAAVGDELVGLCRGFFGAGARSLVVSLWMVDDDSTARLMTRFYEELRAGRSVNRALRAAQLAVKAELGHPYYWAPFILTGDIRTRLSPAWVAH
jgi:CHAT domain-containing protein